MLELISTIISFLVMCMLAYIIFIWHTEISRFVDDMKELRRSLRDHKNQPYKPNNNPSPSFDGNKVLRVLDELTSKVNSLSLQITAIEKQKILNEKEKATTYNIQQPITASAVNRIYLKPKDTNCTEYFVSPEPTEYQVIRDGRYLSLLIDKLTEMNYNDIRILYNKIFTIPQVSTALNTIKIISNPVIEKVDDTYVVTELGKIAVS